MPQEHQVIVVGAGSSGCALSARLAARGISVLLIEAGAGFASQSDFPDEVSRVSSMTASQPGHMYNWSFRGKLSPRVRDYPVARGRVIGGSSTINGAVFVRGIDQDFDEWASAGNVLWSSREVLPFFVRLERDLDFGDRAYHGESGPVPVQRPQEADLAIPSKIFLDGAQALGYDIIEDKNAPHSTGVGPYPMNALDGVRVNAAMAYLLSEPNPNLSVMPDTMVTRILIERGRAIGVETQRAGRSVTHRAGEIVLSAGAIKSPHLLLLSGIGPADHLRHHGIPIVVDLSGVGSEFTDHPALPVEFAIDAVASPSVPVVQVGLTFTSKGSADIEDMEILVGARPSAITASGALTRGSGTPADGLHNFSCQVNRPDSRGQLRLRSSSPLEAPSLDYRYWTDHRDLERARDGVRRAIRILETAPYRRIGARLTTLSSVDVRSDRTLDEWIMSNTVTAIHMASSCRMGASPDAGAVVDQHCRVHGVHGLRVVDTSIMPTVVRRGTAATAVMIGERAAELLT